GVGMGAVREGDAGEVLFYHDQPGRCPGRCCRSPSDCEDVFCRRPRALPWAEGSHPFGVKNAGGSSVRRTDSPQPRATPWVSGGWIHRSLKDCDNMVKPGSPAASLTAEERPPALPAARLGLPAQHRL